MDVKINGVKRDNLQDGKTKGTVARIQFELFALD